MRIIPSEEEIKLKNSVEEVEELVRQTPRGGVPYYNLNASDVAIDTALNFNKDLYQLAPTIYLFIWSAPPTDGVDADMVKAMKEQVVKGKPPAKILGC